MALSIERLDRSRTFGSVHGEGTDIAYEQSARGLQSWPYDAQGQLIEKLLTAEQRAILAELRSKVKDAPATAPSSAKDDDHFVEPDAPAPTPAAEDDDVNLEMWLRGEAKYPNHELRKAVKSRFHANKTDTQSIALYLVEEKKILSRKEVHPSILPALVEA